VVVVGGDALVASLAVLGAERLFDVADGAVLVLNERDGVLVFLLVLVCLASWLIEVFHAFDHNVFLGLHRSLPVKSVRTLPFFKNLVIFHQVGNVESPGRAGVFDSCRSIHVNIFFVDFGFDVSA